MTELPDLWRAVGKLVSLTYSDTDHIQDQHIYTTVRANVSMPYNILDLYKLKIRKNVETMC